MNKFNGNRHNFRHVVDEDRRKRVSFRRNQANTPYEESVELLSYFTGLKVELQDGESVDQLIRRFKRVVEQAGLLRELKKREHYLPPSQKNKEKRRRSAKRLKKRMKMMETVDEDRKI